MPHECFVDLEISTSDFNKHDVTTFSPPTVTAKDQDLGRRDAMKDCYLDLTISASDDDQIFELFNPSSNRHLISSYLESAVATPPKESPLDLINVSIPDTGEPQDLAKELPDSEKTFVYEDYNLLRDLHHANADISSLQLIRKCPAVRTDGKHIFSKKSTGKYRIALFSLSGTELHLARQPYLSHGFWKESRSDNR